MHNLILFFVHNAQDWNATDKPTHLDKFFETTEYVFYNCSGFLGGGRERGVRSMGRGAKFACCVCVSKLLYEATV